MRKRIAVLVLAVTLATPATAQSWLGGGNPAPADPAAGGKAGINAGGASSSDGSTASGGGLGAPVPAPGPSTTGATDAAAIAGAWTCTFTDPTDPSMDGSTAAVAYLPDGTSTADAVFLVPGAVGQDRLFMKVTGTWSLSGRMLTEAMTGFEVVAFEQGGQRIPFASLPPEVQAAFSQGLQAMVGVSAVSDITTLEASRLVVRDQTSGAVSDCRRG